jgi:predicted nucleotidyltransferase
MVAKKSLNIVLIERVAIRLGSLLDRFVFLGGAATDLFITDPAAPGIRRTLDVDVIVEVLSRSAYYRLEDELRSIGFVKEQEEGAPLCRWLVEGVKVDVMPTETEIIGFSNRWYPQALRTSRKFRLTEDMEIRLVTPPCFLATKLEAYFNRGKGDYAASHDMEDIITIIDGRPELIEEVALAPEDLRVYLVEAFSKFERDKAFLDSLAGHLPPDAANQARVPIVRSRITKLGGDFR